MREALFVVNPAGAGHSNLVRRHCHDVALRHGWKPVVLGTEIGEKANEVARQIGEYTTSSGEEKLVFAVGGDGTVRACAAALAGTGRPLAIVPRGAANLFASALGLPRRLEDALRTGFDGSDRLVDIAEVDGETFVAMAGIGIDAAVVASTPHWMKQHLGWVGYGVAAIPHLLAPPHEMTVHLDGRGPIVRRAQAVVVGNVGILPGNFPILAGAVPDDGLLDVGVLEPRGPLGWAHIARHAFLGTGDGQFEHFQATRVQVHAGVELQRELDGDVIGKARLLDVKIRPCALLVRAPTTE